MTTPAKFPHDSTVIIAAFGGWSDAGEAATDAIEHLLEVWDCDILTELPRDEYYDYQFNRPEAALGLDGEREIIWPNTTVYKAESTAMPDTKIFLVLGMEPNFRWKTFCSEIFKTIGPVNNGVLIALGAMLAEVPHSRPMPVHGTTANPILQELTGFAASRYEGQTGILGVMQYEFDQLGISAVSLWAAIPHYVSSAPCTKATLALVRALEDVLDTSIPIAELEEDARAWQTGADEMCAEDDDVAEYVRGLEESHDTTELPEASGEAIAREFERYLRRREN